MLEYIDIKGSWTMNRYKSYQKYLELLDVALTLNDDLIRDYYEKQDSIKKHYLYTKLVKQLSCMVKANEVRHYPFTILAGQLSNILKTKEAEPTIKNKNIQFSYSDDDIEFLKQFDAFELTLQEACLTGKREEYWLYIRSIFSSIKDDELVSKMEEDLNKLNGDYTPRLVWQFYLKHNKKK